jgi:hypothetical protein
MKARATFVAVALIAGVACNGEESATIMTRAELLDPESCKDCHPKHYNEWRGSMHAYASEDPVFVAMNARGQRETDGELGDFCVTCHAPMAVREGKTTDGLNLDELPDHLQGVTCYFCHNATNIGSSHNNADIELANDLVMRAGIDDPVDPKVHGVAYSAFHDRNRIESSLMCGTCHDIVTRPNGVHLERTLKEYRDSVFSKPDGFDSCQGCHMDGRRKGVVAVFEGVPLRSIHEHLWPAVDVALTDFPNREAMRAAVEDCALANSIGFFDVQVTSPIDGSFAVELMLETNAGHNQPSGAAQDRRMWVELIAHDADDEVIFESGTIADGELEEKPEGDPDHDPQLFVLRDRLFDEAGNPVHMFWEAAESQGFTLPPATTASLRHFVARPYAIGRLPARIEVRVRVRPMGIDVLQDLVDSEDLDPAIVEEMPTFTVYAAEVVVDPAPPFDLTITPQLSPDCASYLCLLDPDDCAN